MRPACICARLISSSRSVCRLISSDHFRSSVTADSLSPRDHFVHGNDWPSFEDGVETLGRRLS